MFLTTIVDILQLFKSAADLAKNLIKNLADYYQLVLWNMIVGREI